MSDHAIDVPIGDDGTIHLQPDQLEALGAHPGDNVRILPSAPRRVRSRLGARARELGFTNDHLRAVRSEMGEAVGEDLTR